MKFICIGYLDALRMDALPNEEVDALMRECQSHLKTFHGTGRVVIDAGLDRGPKRLRRSGGKVEAANVPANDSHGTPGSVFLVEAQSMEEAIRIASLHPTVQVGAGERLGWEIDIYPVHTFKSNEGFNDVI
ncbi:YciI family protein [Cohnella rhizosphaerae]|uniref:YciI family protein n=1 Tax=Cohnella rhizosphaerae TaxID=1457232 RepID=A0A9X4QT24_9BACL|nr:YciI family protein [Cohnella rhizosphaerae]MDG0809247.1 YciI family protein [Cohnella rhizosphaerae]